MIDFELDLDDGYPFPCSQPNQHEKELVEDEVPSESAESIHSSTQEEDDECNFVQFEAWRAEERLKRLRKECTEAENDLKRLKKRISKLSLKEDTGKKGN